MKALLAVDVQNDFCPGGAVAVPEGDRVVPVINRLMERFPLVLASRDWHPPQSDHFKKWPPHCIQNTHGAEFHPQLARDRIDVELLKGTTGRDDGYSAFEATNVDLAQLLHEKNVGDLYIAGLATDYCVRASALDAARHGFRTWVITDAIAAVNLDPNDVLRALEEMQKAGVIAIASAETE